MKLSKPVKILIGAGTGIYALFPLFLFFIWLLAVFTILVTSNYQGEPSPIFFVLFSLMFPAICLVNLLHLALVSFYITHMIKNNTANETLRVLLALGLFFLPWLAMPVYLLIYILPSQPPEWALIATKPSTSTTATTQSQAPLGSSQDASPSIPETPAAKAEDQPSQLPGDATLHANGESIADQDDAKS